ncbi:MAG: hypothetical protein AAF489_11275 [Bacteroidota bacterium]
MSRIHAFEFEDLGWFPHFLRNYGTDFLQYLSNKMKIYRPIVPLLEEALLKSGQDRIVDLGSGGGGGLFWINQQLKKSHPKVKIVLTDLYPNQTAFKRTKELSADFEYLETPVDARDVPDHLKGLRTQFLSLHHFRPEDAQKILQNAVDSGSSIAIFEAQERSIASFIGMFISPITLWVTTPFIRPFKIGRILFTYFIPIVPLFVWWDGMASVLRTYSVNEMNALVQNLENKDSFNWNVGRIKDKLGVNLYLIGTKK